jgi:hypothetical protein
MPDYGNRNVDLVHILPLNPAFKQVLKGLVDTGEIHHSGFMDGFCIFCALNPISAGAIRCTDALLRHTAPSPGWRKQQIVDTAVEFVASHQALIRVRDLARLI